MSTLEFRDVLDEISEAWLFLYLEFDMNKYLKNWGNYEVLQIELRKFIVTVFFYLWNLPCTAMFLLAVLEFGCIECFAYALAGLILVFEHVPQTYCIPLSF